MDLSFLDLDTLDVSGQLYDPATLPPGKELQVPIFRMFGGANSRSGRYGEVKILDLTGTPAPTPLSSSPYSQSIYRLRYNGSY
jgi:hypothetical protein